MQRGNGYVIAYRRELERNGNWTLVRRSLDCQAFALSPSSVSLSIASSLPASNTLTGVADLDGLVGGSQALLVDASAVLLMALLACSAARAAWSALISFFSSAMRASIDSRI